MSDVGSDEVLLEEATIHPRMDQKFSSDLDPVEVFFDQISNSTQRYGTSLRRLRSTCTSILSTEHVSQVVLATMGVDEEPTNRDDARRFRKDVSDTRRNIKPAIVYGRASAQAYVWHTDSESDDNADMGENIRIKVKEVYAAYYQIAKDESVSPGMQFSATTWLDVFETQKDVCEAEKELYNDLRIFLGIEANNIVDLLAYIRSSNFDKDENLPFLKFLANNLYDPQSDNAIERRLDELLARPEIYTPVFCDFIDQCFDDDEETRTFAIEGVGEENLSWLSFIAQNVADDEGTVGEFFAHKPLNEWPQPLYDRLIVAHDQLIGAIHTAYKELLAPYVDSKSFFVDPQELTVMLDNGTTRTHGNGNLQTKKNRRSKNGGRTTIKSRPDAYLPEEETQTRIVDGINVWSSIGERRYIQSESFDLAEEERPLKEVLLELATVKNYLKGRADPKITDDIVAMVESLLDEPYGNGAAKLNGRTVSFGDNPQSAKQYPIWHLNPNKRTGLSIGDTGRNTRIDFVPYRNEKGTMCIAILDIGHKSSLVKSKGHIGGN